jgi:hypothetical protein
MASAIPVPARDTAQEVDLSQSFWQRAAELGALDEQHRLAAIDQGWSSSWLGAPLAPKRVSRLADRSLFRGYG